MNRLSVVLFGALLLSLVVDPLHAQPPDVSDEVGSDEVITDEVITDEAVTDEAVTDEVVPDVPADTVDGAEGELVRLVLVNEMGSLFELSSMDAYLNDRAIEMGEIIDGAQQVVFEGRLPRGRHVLVVDIVYTGDGELFTSYLDELEFHVLRQVAFEVGEGGSLVELVVYESGGFFTEMAERPALAYRVRPLSGEPG